MPESKTTYKGALIEIDLELMRFKRDADNDWMKLPEPRYVALTQRKMQQRGGIRASWVLHKYNAFCVYIKAGKLNILAYQGRRDKVMREGAMIADFLNVKIHDIIPRDKYGKVIDDDFQSPNQLPTIAYFIMGIVFLLLLSILCN